MTTVTQRVARRSGGQHNRFPGARILGPYHVSRAGDDGGSERRALLCSCSAAGGLVCPRVQRGECLSVLRETAWRLSIAVLFLLTYDHITPSDGQTNNRSRPPRAAAPDRRGPAPRESPRHKSNAHRQGADMDSTLARAPVCTSEICTLRRPFMRTRAVVEGPKTLTGGTARGGPGPPGHTKQDQLRGAHDAPSELVLCSAHRTSRSA